MHQYLCSHFSLLTPFANTLSGWAVSAKTRVAVWKCSSNCTDLLDICVSVEWISIVESVCAGIASCVSRIAAYPFTWFSNFRTWPASPTAPECARSVWDIATKFGIASTEMNHEYWTRLENLFSAWVWVRVYFCTCVSLHFVELRICSQKSELRTNETCCGFKVHRDKSTANIDRSPCGRLSEIHLLSVIATDHGQLRSNCVGWDWTENCSTPLPCCN